MSTPRADSCQAGRQQRPAGAELDGGKQWEVPGETGNGDSGPGARGEPRPLTAGGPAAAWQEGEARTGGLGPGGDISRPMGK